MSNVQSDDMVVYIILLLVAMVHILNAMVAAFSAFIAPLAVEKWAFSYFPS
jgi:hypothetical protein